MKKHVFSLLLIHACVIVSCSPVSSTIASPTPSEAATLIVSKEELAFLRMFPNEEMNTFIKFWPDAEFLDDGRCLDLSLENISGERIIFPSDFGIRILTYTNEADWVGIENSVQYVPPGNRQVSPKRTNNPGVIGVALCPVLTDSELPIGIRVVVIGQTEAAQGEVPKSVGAYIDLVMKK